MIALSYSVPSEDVVFTGVARTSPEVTFGLGPSEVGHPAKRLNAGLEMKNLQKKNLQKNVILGDIRMIVPQTNKI